MGVFRQCDTPHLFIMNLELYLDNFLKTFRAEFIQSRTNPKTVAFSKLSDKKYRDKSGLFLAEGVKLTEEALKYADAVDTVIFSQSAVERHDDRIVRLAETANELDIRVSVFADSAFEKISTESAPQGVIAVVKYLDDLHQNTDFEKWQKGKRLLMLEEIRDPGNLGTIMRSAEAMGVDGVILSGCADLYQPKTVRAAMGTLFRLPAFITNDGVSCVEIMKQNDRRVLAAALGEHTLTLGKYEIYPTDCPVIGNEGHGIPQEMIEKCTACVKIPMAGNTESLNASAAAACILWEYFR